MIEDVSNRIRNIINSQDYTPKQRLLKSRDNSTSKQEESIHSRKNLQYPPKTPQPKFKRKDSQISLRQQVQNKPTRQHHNLPIDLKKQILNLIEPLLYQMEKRIMQKLITLQQQYLQSTESMQYIKKNRSQLTANYTTFGRQQNSRKRQQIIQQVYKIIEPMAKHSNRLDQEISLIKQKFSSKLKDIQFEGKKRNKCRCQPLIEQILRSQSHLMMQLKYIKHFRGKQVLR